MSVVPPRFLTQRQECRIHRPGAGHLHMAVCPSCQVPIDAQQPDALQAFCWHPDAKLGQVRWRCVEGSAPCPECAAPRPGEHLPTCQVPHRRVSVWGRRYA